MEGSSALTNWAFSQLCQRVGAPAGYLRSLPADVTAQCLEHGIGKSGDDCNILTRRNPDVTEDGAPNLAAAFTSGSYGRIWDYDVLTELKSAIADSGWRTPPSLSNGSSGLYASDRDILCALRLNPFRFSTVLRPGRRFGVESGMAHH